MTNEMLEAAIGALAETLAPTDDIDEVELRLELFGQAIAAEIPLPCEASRWLEAATNEQLEAVAARWLERVRTTAPPAIDAAGQVEWFANQSARAQGVLVAIRRACIGSDRVFGAAVPSYSALEGVASYRGSPVVIAILLHTDRTSVVFATTRGAPQFFEHPENAVRSLLDDGWTHVGTRTDAASGERYEFWERA